MNFGLRGQFFQLMNVIQNIRPHVPTKAKSVVMYMSKPLERYASLPDPVFPHWDLIQFQDIGHRSTNAARAFRRLPVLNWVFQEACQLSSWCKSFPHNQSGNLTKNLVYILMRMGCPEEAHRSESTGSQNHKEHHVIQHVTVLTLSGAVVLLQMEAQCHASTVGHKVWQHPANHFDGSLGVFFLVFIW